MPKKVLPNLQSWTVGQWTSFLVELRQRYSTGIPARRAAERPPTIGRVIPLTFASTAIVGREKS
jgi:hypothetical protein